MDQSLRQPLLSFVMALELLVVLLERSREISKTQV